MNHLVLKIVEQDITKKTVNINYEFKCKLSVFQAFS